MTHWLASLPSPDLSPLVESAFRGLLLALLVGCGLALLRVRNVVAAKTAWVLVLAAAFAMPVLAPAALRIPLSASEVLQFKLHRTAPASQPVSISPAPASSTQATSFSAPDEPGTPTDDALLAKPVSAPVSAPVAAPIVTAPAPSHAAALTTLLTRPQWLFLLYVAVCATLLFRLFFGLFLARRLWSAAKPLRYAGASVYAPGIPIRVTLRITSPLNVASGILLPAGAAEWDRETMNIVLAHEASHVRQRDFYLQFAVGLYASIFWFSPLGWWLKRTLSDLSEAISDRAGMEEAPSPASYAQVLLQFAALPRPSQIGVAMARPGRLTHRIERLLNQSSFHQAFARTGVRLATAVLLVPVALFAATALVRVQAAQEPQIPPAADPAPVVPAQPAPAHPTPAQEAAPQSIPAPSAAPTALPEPAAAPAAPVPPQLNAPIHLQIPTTVDISPEVQALVNAHTDKIRSSVLLATTKNALINARVQAQIARAMARDGQLAYWLGNNREPYAIVIRTNQNGSVHVPKTRTWQNMGDSLDEYKADIDKAKSVAHGDFIWFRRDGKSYVIDDPAILAEVKTMQEKMDALGKQQEALGKQQEALGKQQEELGRQMNQVKVPTPDMQKELTKLQAVQAKLAALQGKEASQQQLSEIQGELAQVQGRIGAIQGNMGGRMGDLGGKMGALGDQQGKLGAEQGRIGAQQGRLAREMDGKILSTIDESLKNGKAKPVQ